MDKKIHFEMINLMKKRALETVEQRKERLRIRREKIEQEGEPKNYKRKRNCHQKQKTMRTSAWPLSKYLSYMMEMSLERKLRLEKVDASKQLRLAMETE